MCYAVIALLSLAAGTESGLMLETSLAITKQFFSQKSFGMQLPRILTERIFSTAREWKEQLNSSCVVPRDVGNCAICLCKITEEERARNSTERGLMTCKDCENPIHTACYTILTQKTGNKCVLCGSEHGYSEKKEISLV